MPFCTNNSYTIDVLKENGTLIERLVFRLTINAGAVSGNVLHADLSVLSPLSGSCLPIPNPDISLMHLVFRWDTVRVFMVGVVYRDGDDLRVKFRGRFRAFPAIGLTEKSTTLKKRTADDVLPLGPGDGETGTATGTQT